MFRSRSALWVRCADPHEGCDGVLQIDQRRGPTPGVAERDVYGVREHPSAFDDERRFHLLGLVDFTKRRIIEVIVGRYGHSCTCDLGKFQVLCVHIISIKLVLEAGGLDRTRVGSFAPFAFPEPVNGDCWICGNPMGKEPGYVHMVCDEAADSDAMLDGEMQRV